PDAPGLLSRTAGAGGTRAGRKPLAPAGRRTLLLHLHAAVAHRAEAPPALRAAARLHAAPDGRAVPALCRQPGRRAATVLPAGRDAPPLPAAVPERVRARGATE